MGKYVLSKKRYLFAVFLFSVFSQLVFAQGEIVENRGTSFTNERTIAILINSTGFGGNIRFGNRLDGTKKRVYEVDFVSIKHPKEVKRSNPLYENQESFVYGKLNYFFSLRVGYGRQKELFGKFDEGGISIRYFCTFGPSLGMLKPIYYETLYRTQDNSINFRVEKFNSSAHNVSDISGKAPFRKGLNEISVVPGGFIKLGFGFDYSKLNGFVNALEIGAIVDVFGKEIPIMATDNNEQVFLSLFVNYRFGKNVNPRTKNSENMPGFFNRGNEE